jgi:Anti-sigma factor NepR
MASDRKSPSASPAPQRAPEWADGLKQLYDSVVEEDLPDSFKNLLARLDEIDPRRGSADDGSPSQSPDGRGAQQ